MYHRGAHNKDPCISTDAGVGVERWRRLKLTKHVVSESRGYEGPSLEKCQVFGLLARGFVWCIFG